MKKLFPALLVLLLGFTGSAQAHIGVNDIPSAPHGAYFYQPMIGNIQGSCIAANGQPVPLISDHTLNDVGKADSWNGQWVIFMNPHVLTYMPAENQQFWYAHECAHVSLPTMNEDQADCAAVKIGRNQGWLSPAGINSLCYYFQGNPGDWTHSLGPVRCQNMTLCYAVP
jgi:hypothetical protein